MADNWMKGNRLTPPGSQIDLFDVAPHVGFAGCGQLSEDWTIVQTSSGRRHLPGRQRRRPAGAILWLVSGFAARRFAARRLIVSRHAASRDTGFASRVISYRL